MRTLNFIAQNRFFAAVILAGFVFFQTNVVGMVGEENAQGKSTWSGIYTDAQASRGESVYRSSCAVCHGDDLAGSEMGPGLAGSAFLEFWDGLSLGDLLQVITVSMPQDNPGSLETSEYVDVIAYMLQKSEFPTGSEELPADQSGLGEFVISAQEGQ